MTAKPRRKTFQAPKGRNNPAQGNALGNTAPEDRSPEPERSGDRSPTGDRVAVNEVNQRARQISSATHNNGWRNTTLGAVITGIDTGKSFRCEERPPIASEVGVVKVSAVTWGTYDEEESKTCLDAARIEPRYLIEEGDFLFSRANTIQLIGACVIAGATSRRLMLSDKILRFRFTDEVEPKWVLHWLRSKQGRSEIERLSSGNQESMRNIGQERIRAIALPLPPIEDQRRIVAEIEKQFTRLEAGVAALRRVQANLKRYRAAVLKAACEGCLVPTEAELSRSGVPPLEPPPSAQTSSKRTTSASSVPKRQDAASTSTFESGQQLLARILTERRQNWQGRGKYKEPASLSASGYEPESLPEGWGIGTVEQLNQSNRPCAYGVLQPGEDLKDGVPFVRVGDINDGKVSQDAMKRIAPAIAAQYPRTKLHGGELAITLVGAIGRTAVIPDSLAGGNTARAVGIIPLTKLVNPHWVEIWFRNPAKVAEMTGKSHEVARKTLNLEDVRAASVALPPSPNKPAPWRKWSGG